MELITRTNINMAMIVAAARPPEADASGHPAAAQHPTAVVAVGRHRSRGGGADRGRPGPGLLVVRVAAVHDHVTRLQPSFRGCAAAVDARDQRAAALAAPRIRPAIPCPRLENSKVGL